MMKHPAIISIPILLAIGILILRFSSESVSSTNQKAVIPEKPINIIGSDDAPMVLILAGKFEMGTNSSEIPQLVRWAKEWYFIAAEWYEDETPRHTVYLDDFYMDKYEVTNAQYARFLNAYGTNTDQKGHKLLDIDSPDCLIEKSEDTYKPKPGFEEHPVIEVSWYGASIYAQFYDKQLPTEAEWEKAARGGLVGMKFPWGDMDPNGNMCNFADMNVDFSWADKNTNDGYERTAPVGSYHPNRYGLYDMAGNVWEWCADRYDLEYYPKSPENNPKGPTTPTIVVLRGGSWNYASNDLRNANRHADCMSTASAHIGFRCVKRN